MTPRHQPGHRQGHDPGSGDPGCPVAPTQADPPVNPCGLMHAHAHMLTFARPTRTCMHTTVEPGSPRGGLPGTEGPRPAHRPHRHYVGRCSCPVIPQGTWSAGQEAAQAQDSQTPPSRLLCSFPWAVGWGGVPGPGRLCLTGTGRCVCMSPGPCVSPWPRGLSVCLFWLAAGDGPGWPATC